MIDADVRQDQRNAFAIIEGAIRKLRYLQECRESYFADKAEIFEIAELLRLMKKHRIPLRAAKAVRKALKTGQPLELGKDYGDAM